MSDILHHPRTIDLGGTPKRFENYGQLEDLEIAYRARLKTRGQSLGATSPSPAMLAQIANDAAMLQHIHVAMEQWLAEHEAAISNQLRELSQLIATL